MITARRERWYLATRSATYWETVFRARLGRLENPSSGRVNLGLCVSYSSVAGI